MTFPSRSGQMMLVRDHDEIVKWKDKKLLDLVMELSATADESIVSIMDRHELVLEVRSDR